MLQKYLFLYEVHQKSKYEVCKYSKSHQLLTLSPVNFGRFVIKLTLKNLYFLNKYYY